MGSVVPRSRSGVYVASLFLEIQRRVNAAAAEGEEPDKQLVADLLADALAHPDTRQPILAALSCFICSSLAGSVPDPERWSPK